MKKIISICGLAFVGMNLFTVPVQAETGAVISEGEATFVPQSGDIQTIKPGTDEKIKIEDGTDQSVTVDYIQLMHVPDFRFGSNETDVNTKNYDAIFEHYTKISDPATKYAIPHFVQVGDVSGVEGTKWKVTVEQGATFKEANGHTLKNTRIQLYNQTLTNNVRNDSVATMVKGLDIPKDGTVTIPVKGESGPLAVLTSLAGKDTASTNGTISSVVFEGDYQEASYGTASSPGLNEKNAGVKLNVPQSDGVQAKKYTAALNWTLTVEP